jgi:hypothetical protein
LILRKVGAGGTAPVVTAKERDRGQRAISLTSDRNKSREAAERGNTRALEKGGPLHREDGGGGQFLTLHLQEKKGSREEGVRS